VERNNKDQDRNDWNGDLKNMKNQLIKKLVLW
jgi:hypothetical protein